MPDSTTGRSRAPHLPPVTRVLVANRGGRDQRTVTDKWESSPYEVVAVNSDINVYQRSKIKDVNSDKVKVVHRNILLPANFLPVRDMQELHSGDSDEVVHGVNPPHEEDVL